MIDFIAQASDARWYGGVRQMAGSVPVEITEFGLNAPTRESGIVETFDTPQRMENGRFYQPNEILHMHPAWQPDGMLVGIYPVFESQEENERFQADVGFLEGAVGTDGVTFEFGYMRDIPGFDPAIFFNTSRLSELNGFYLRVASQTKTLNGRLSEINGSTTRLGNRETYFPVLIVRAGRASGRDWACWIAPEQFQSRAVNIQNLNCILETSGSGSDEVAFCLVAVGKNADGILMNETSMILHDSATGVNSGDPVDISIPEMAFDDKDIATVEFRVLCAEVDGAGSTANLTDHIVNKWSATIQLGLSTTFNRLYDFVNTPRGPRIRNRHDTIFTDFWEVEWNNWRSGGRDPDRPILPVGGVETTVEEHLSSIGISRAVSLVRNTSSSIETRSYTSTSQGSVYSLSLVYE